MLEIKPISDKNEQKNICEKCGMNYREELFAYKAYESGSLLACAQFDICGKDAVIYGMRQVIGSKDDFEAMFILGRAVLNFLDLCGVINVTYNVENLSDEKLAKLIGFKKNESDIMSICLTGLFTSPCKHGNSYQDTKENAK